LARLIARAFNSGRLTSQERREETLRHLRKRWTGFLGYKSKDLRGTLPAKRRRFFHNADRA
jgi:hypothetical protein